MNAIDGSKDAKSPSSSSSHSFSTSPLEMISSIDQAAVLELPMYKQYLNKIYSMPLRDLEREISFLQEKTDDLSLELSKLFGEEYQAALELVNLYLLYNETCEYTNHIKQKIRKQTFTKAEQSLLDIESLTLSDMQELGIHSHSAQASWNEKSRNIDLIYAQYSNIMKVLEVPNLLRDLVENGMYDDAMDLHHYAQRLKLRYPKVRILCNIANDMSSIDLMIHKLLLSLQSDLSLYDSIRNIGHLKRTEIMRDDELRELFLLARYNYYENLLNENLSRISESKSYKSSTDSMQDSQHAESRRSSLSLGNQSSYNLKTRLETSRNCFIEMITQYQAIFGHSLGSFISSDSSKSAIFTLHSFLHYSMKRLMHQISKDLSGIDECASINHLLIQATHFGVALGRKGFDARVMITPPFCDRIYQIVSNILKNSTESFQLELENNGVANMISRDRGRLDIEEWLNSISSYLQSNSTIITSSESFSSNSNESQKSLRKLTQPPKLLLEFPALSALTNGYLTAMNSLRVLPLTSLFLPIGRELVKNIEHCIISIKHAYENTIESNEFGNYENSTHSVSKEYDIVVSRVLVNVWIPFCLRCYFDTLYADIKDLGQIDKSFNSSNAVKGSGIPLDVEESLRFLRSLVPRKVHENDSQHELPNQVNEIQSIPSI